MSQENLTIFFILEYVKFYMKVKHTFLLFQYNLGITSNIFRGMI